MTVLREVVEDMATDVSETAEQVAEVSRTISSREIRYLTTGIVVGCSIGLTVGYRVAKRRLEDQSARYADIEIEEMRRVFEELKTKKDEELAQMRVRLHDEVTGPKPELDNVMEHLGYKSPNNRPNVGVPVEEPKPAENDTAEDTRNVFEESGWDYAKEVKSRSNEIPYIIHADEHEAGEKGYDNASLTFYEDDDVLADEDDAVIDHNVVGMHNLTRFGHGSNNPDILYIRNDVLEIDYEIARSTGSYAQEVHGLKHEDGRRKRQRDWNG